MSEFRTLVDANIAIVGLGLMGGSLAMALHGRCARLIGIDHDQATLQLARELDIVDYTSANTAKALSQANVIILATPVRAILQLLADLPRLHPGTAVVLDLGSTKKAIMTVMTELPTRFDPLGGHPMCGKEISSLNHADPTIYQNAPFAFTPLPRTTDQARALAIELAEILGAHPLWLDADTHDRWTAASSHLPYVVANALAGITSLETTPLISTGYRSTTRVATTDTAVMRDILTTNRTEILAALTRFRQRLNELESCLTNGDDEALMTLLVKGMNQQQHILNELGD